MYRRLAQDQRLRNNEEFYLQVRRIIAPHEMPVNAPRSL